MLVGSCLTHEDGQRHQDNEIDVEKLGISEVRTDGVKQGHRAELDHRVELHKLKTLERGCQGCSSFS